MTKAVARAERDARTRAPPQTDLEAAVTAARSLQEAILRRADLEEQLRAAKTEIHHISTKTVVDIFDRLGIDHVGVPPQGNRPGFEVTVATSYEGGISAEWDDDRRDRAFAALEKFGHGGLIKSIVEVLVPREKVKLLDKVTAAVRKLGLTAMVRKGVHHSTFKAWLREEFESGRPMPDLETIGAVVIRRASIRERKE